MRFHEAPLVVFTALATAGAGVLAGALLEPLAGAPVALQPLDAVAATLLIGAGFVFSTGHLGRPLRAPLAMRRVGRSPLSTEVALGALVFALAASAATAEATSHPVPWLDGPVVVAAAAFLVALGLVYRLPGQAGWGIESTVSPLAAGILSGAIWHQLGPAGLVPSAGGNSLVMPLAYAAGADLVVLAARWWRVETATRKGKPTYPGPFALRRSILGARLVTLDVLAPLLALVHLPAAAVAAALAGLALDRFAFYALAVRQAVEVEIERVEAVIAREG